MPENNVKRKLRAILSADVKGYSRMMGEDEDGTYQTLTANLKSISSIISKHDGRILPPDYSAVHLMPARPRRCWRISPPSMLKYSVGDRSACQLMA